MAGRVCGQVTWDTHPHVHPLLALRKGIWGLLSRPVLAQIPTPHCGVDQEMGPCLSWRRKDCFTGRGPSVAPLGVGQMPVPPTPGFLRT